MRAGRKLNTHHSTLNTRLYASLAGVEVGDDFPVRIVGAINVSRESFYSGSVAISRGTLQRRAEQMVHEGADIIDVGAMSTAPYVRGAISEAEEERRMRAAVRALRPVVSVPLSVDTQRSRVAAAALAAGASIINDVSGLSGDVAMSEVARAAAGVILMACEESATRQDPLVMIATLLQRSLLRAQQAGIARRCNRCRQDVGLASCVMGFLFAPDANRIEHGRNPAGRDLGIIGNDGGEWIPAHFRSGHIMGFQVVGVQFDEARQQQIAAEIPSPLRRRAATDLGNAAAADGHPATVDHLVGENDHRIGNYELQTFVRHRRHFE